MRCRHGLVAVIGLVLLGAIQAQAAQKFGDIVINVDPPARSVAGSGGTHHGYLEYRITVINRSKTSDHNVTFYMPRRAWGAGDHSMRSIERSITIAADTTMRVSLLQPPVPLGGNGLGVAIDGRKQRDSLMVAMPEHIQRWGHYGGGEVAILSSQGVGASFWSSFNDSGASGRSLGSFVSEVPVKTWSRQWLGYSRFDAVTVTAGEFEAMPSEVRNAVLRYVECGGCLIIKGDMQPPKAWSRYHVPENDLNTYMCGFGVIYITGSKQKQSDFSRPAGRIWRSAERTSQPFQFIRGVESANNAFPVVKELGIPVRGLFVVMLLFAVTIGPVNLIVLAKMRKRMWLLWTVPVISLFTCLVVIGYATFAEGWRGKARVESVTILDEAAQRATSIGWSAFYAPITPLRGLTFGYDTELTPHHDSGSYGDGRSRSMNWNTNQHLSNGWVIARVPAHFLVRKSEPLQRERLNFKKQTSTTLEVTNGLGSDVLSLWAADSDGRVFHAMNVDAGGTTTLKLHATDKAKGTPEKLRQRVFASDWLGEIRRLGSDRYAHEYLQPNTYIAVLESAPFMEEGLNNLKTRQARTVVYGFAKEAIDAD